MNSFQKIIIIFIFVILIFFIINSYFLSNKEHLYVPIWTPYYLDINNQPGYTSYFYRNGFMYPVY